MVMMMKNAVADADIVINASVDNVDNVALDICYYRKAISN